MDWKKEHKRALSLGRGFAALSNLVLLAIFYVLTRSPLETVLCFVAFNIYQTSRDYHAEYFRAASVYEAHAKTERN